MFLEMSFYTNIPHNGPSTPLLPDRVTRFLIWKQLATRSRGSPLPQTGECTLLNIVIWCMKTCTFLHARLHKAIKLVRMCLEIHYTIW